MENFSNIRSGAARNNIDQSFGSIMLDMSQRHSVLYAKCRNAIIAEYRGQAKGPKQGRKAIRNMLQVVIKELGGRYHPAHEANGKHFDAFVQFTDGTKAKVWG